MTRQPATRDPVAGITPVSRHGARDGSPGRPGGSSPAYPVAGEDPSPSQSLPGPCEAAAGTPAPVTGAARLDRDAAPARGRTRSPAGGARASSSQATSAPPAGSTGLAVMAAAMTEDRGRDSLEARMRRIMKDLGLWGYHPRRSEKSEKGWPDWTIIGARIIYRELKTERGKVTPEQEAVGQRITRAGGDWAVWRPSDLLSGRIAGELRAITAGPLGLGGAA